MLLRRTFRLLTHGIATAAMLCLLSSLPAARAQQTAAPGPAAPSPAMLSQDAHLVSPLQLQQQVQTASAVRQKNIDTLTQFVSTPQAVQVMESHNIDPAQVTHAIPTLSDAELADLSARAAHAQRDFAAGFLGIGTFLLIILIVVVIIIVAVFH